jgi:FkbM family methyltransferase
LAISSNKAIKKVERWIKWLIGRDVYRRPQVTVPTERFGDPGGELWTIATEGVHRGTVLYTFGVGTDIGFERAVIERFGLSVHAFDPTPIALQWVGSQRLPDRFVLHPFGVADYDGTAQFAGPSSEKYISYSLVRRSGLGVPVDAPVRRIATLHNELRLPAPDIIKMDIEGATTGCWRTC